MSVVDEFIGVAKSIYGEGFIPLHRPVFEGNEKEYLAECIDSNFVSSVGKKVIEFEDKMVEFTGAKHAVAVVNGTSGLHACLSLTGAKSGDEVITQALTFVATCNAISYTGATPVFIDVDKDTLGMSATALSEFLQKHCYEKKGVVYNKSTGRRIVACMPMHTFGIPCRIVEISEICREWGISLIEDSAESLGSKLNNKHTGTFGDMAVVSFNGNKIITTGGGGMILSNNPSLAERIKHLTTTAKAPHPYEFIHDQIAFNYRMPNLNAALGCAQMELLPKMLKLKSDLAAQWHEFFSAHNIDFCNPINGTTSNHWLNGIVLPNRQERDNFLRETNERGVMTRPIWRLMSELDMYKGCQHDGLEISKWLEERVVNIPSSVPEGILSGQ